MLVCRSGEYLMRVAKWGKEEIANLSNQQIQTLRENAARLARLDVIELCNEELDNRKPLRT